MTDDQQKSEDQQPPETIEIDPARLPLAMAETVKALIDARERQPDGPALIRFFASVQHESDRALPIMCFSYLEMELESLMMYAMKIRDARSTRDLFKGPLYSANAKIELAYALGWIDEKVKAAIHNLKVIRNQFGHQAVFDGFDDEKVMGLVLSHTGFVQMKPTAKITNETVRGIYLYCFADTAWRLIGQSYVLPILSQYPVDPSAFMHLDSEHRPEALKHLDGYFTTMMRILSLTHGNAEGKATAFEPWGNQKMEAPGSGEQEILDYFMHLGLPEDG